MSKLEIKIVDRGRGPQLSTSRITVLDLVPYFQNNLSFEDIARWMPTLSQEEVSVLKQYYAEHQQEMDEADRQARLRREDQIRQQRMKFPELNGSPEERKARLRELLEKHRQEKRR